MDGHLNTRGDEKEEKKREKEGKKEKEEGKEGEEGDGRILSNLNPCRILWC